MKQKLALILALLMLSASFASCADTAEETPSETSTPEAVETTAETESAEPEWTAFANLPKENYDGRTFTILARIENESQFFAEEYNGDSVNDAVYDRNAAVVEQYNITLDVPTIDGSWGNNTQYTNAILASIQAGDGAYDLIDGYAAVIGSLVMEGCYLNLNDVAYIEPSEKWWSKSAVEDLSINGQVYLTPGDISMSLYDNIFALFFNQNLLAEYGLEDPYTLVEEEKWTYDAFLNIAETCLIDVDGNGKYDEQDIYGIVFSDDLEFNNFHFAFEIPITVKGDDGYPKFALDDERVADLITTMQDLAYRTNGVYYYKGNDDGKLKMFMEGRAVIMANLLSSTVSLRDMEDDFGILPYPKYNENQDGYHTTSRDNSILFGIPIDVKDATFAGLISEALCQKSYETVKPIYYETVLKTKLARDTESQKMIDILRDGLIFDMGAVYALQLERAGFLTRDCVYYEYDYASRFKTYQKVFDRAMDTFLDKFKDN